jgi:hypothetical protein
MLHQDRAHLRFEYFKSPNSELIGARAHARGGGTFPPCFTYFLSVLCVSLSVEVGKRARAGAVAVWEATLLLTTHAAGTFTISQPDQFHVLAPPRSPVPCTSIEFATAFRTYQISAEK